MPKITAVMIDSREPAWVQGLKFDGVPTTVTALDTGDVMAVTDDGHTIIVERKTPDDFLNTLKEDRLFPQLARMMEARTIQQNNNQPVTIWAYLIITEPIVCNRDGKVTTQRGVTGWSFASVMGTILSIQGMGIFVIFCNGDMDYQDCILRLGRRSRDADKFILPARPVNVLGPKANFLAGLPGIGIEKVQEILEWSNDNIAHALSGLTDFEIKSPIGLSLRKNIRNLLGLQDNENLDVVVNEKPIPDSKPKKTTEQLKKELGF